MRQRSADVLKDVLLLLLLLRLLLLLLLLRSDI
jgi:hypothetical protein